MRRRACLNNRRSCNRIKKRDAYHCTTEQSDESAQESLVNINVSETVSVSAAASNDPALDEAIRRSLDDIAQGATAAEAEIIVEGSSDKIVVDAVASDNPDATEEADALPAVSTGDSVAVMDVVLDDLVVNEQIKMASLDDLVESEQTNIVAKEASFADEAIGSGDVAAFVGETLDRLSEAIENLSAEMDDYASGSKIVDGDEDAASTGSWSVVVEKEDAVIVGDEGLARAAEAIGSALFQSDMMRSIEDGTLSSIASVPTCVPSISPSEQEIPQALLDRWAPQLEQLRELGFADDAACVDAMEALAAANIGVDSDEEVTVQQVVEKLMSD